MPARAVCVVLVLAACGAPSPGTIQSGARLHTIDFVDSDGDRVFAGLHDQDLDADCTWEATADGTPRCLPAHDTTALFLDAACTHPVDTTSSGACTAPRFVTVSRDACTGAPSELWRVGGAITPTTLYTYDSTSGSCTATLPDATTTYLDTAAQVAMTDVVGGVYQDLGDGRVRYHTIQGSDGSWFPAGAYDTDLDAPCSMQGDAHLCVPVASYSSYSLDASCTPRAVFAQHGCAPAPFITASTDAFHVYHLGDVVSPPPTRLYIDLLVVATGWTCSGQDVSINAGYDTYASGDEVPLDSLATLQAGRVDGARLDTWVWVAGSYQQYDHVHDRVLDVDCTPTAIGDGTYRCLPSLPGVYAGTNLFADASCVAPLPPQIWKADDDPAQVALDAGTDACAPSLHSVTIGARLPGVWFLNNGSCQEIDGNGEHAYAVGAATTLDAYAAMTRQSD